MKPIIPFVALMLLASCGGNKKGLADGASGDMDAYESSEVNAIVQSKPEIMIIPSDGTLKNFGALTVTNIDGKDVILRDYSSYLIKDDRAKRLNSFIQDAFQKVDFPLTDLELTLKQLDTKSATDLAEGLQKDSKAILLNTARPDIILELDYSTSRDKKLSAISHDYNRKDTEKNVNYTLTALDAYTNKSVATVTASNIKGKSTTEAIKEDLNKKLPAFMDDVQGYFSDVLKRGREITVRIVLGKNSDVTLSEESVEDEPYSDYITDYIKNHTVKGAYKLQTNTASEMFFTNCRIKLLNEDGTQYGVYDWARDFAKKMRKDLGLKVTNASQGLGEVVLQIDGLK